MIPQHLLDTPCFSIEDIRAVALPAPQAPHAAKLTGNLKVFAHVSLCLILIFFIAYCLFLGLESADAAGLLGS